MLDGVGNEGSNEVSYTLSSYLGLDGTQSNNNDNQDLSLCALSCFAVTHAQSTVPYFSMGQPRNVTLLYHGDRVAVRPFVHVDVWMEAGAPTLDEYWLQLKDSTGTLVTFLNGDSKLRFANPTAPSNPTQRYRLSGQFDASAYPTGMHRFTILVTAKFSASQHERAIATRFMIVNERKSAAGRGWTIAGVPRIYVQSDSQVLMTEGDGSALFFRYGYGFAGQYVSPAGDFSKLTKTGAGVSLAFTRSFPDSTKIWFSSTGRADSIGDRFGNKVRFGYDGSNRLTKIYDPIRTYNAGASRSYIELNYGTYGLTTIKEPGPTGTPATGRTTTITVASDSTLSVFKDPDGDSTRFTYDASRRLERMINRRGDTTRFVYRGDGSWKVASVELPRVPIDVGGGNTVDSVVVTSFVPWHVAGLPTATTAVTPAAAARSDTVRGRVTDGAGFTEHFTVDAWGQPLVITDGVSRQTTILRNGILPVKITNPAGGSDSLAYDSRGLISYRKAAGQTAARLYYTTSRWGLPDSIVQPGHPKVALTIGTNGHVDAIKIENVLTRLRADSKGRDTLVLEHDTTRRTQYRYDAAFGQLDSVHAPGSFFSKTVYDGYGRDSVLRVVGQPARTTLYDNLNRVTEFRDGVNAVPTRFSYDKLYRIRVQDPDSQVFRFQVNALGAVTREYDPADTLSRYISYRYDPRGLLTSTTNRRGQRVNYTYDAIARITGKAGDNVVSATFGYDNATSRKMVASNAASIDSIFTDSTGWVTSQVTRFVGTGKRFQISFRADSVQRLDSMAIQDSAGVIVFAQRLYRWDAAKGVLQRLIVGTDTVRPGVDGELRMNSMILPGSLTKSIEFTNSHRRYSVTYNNLTVNAALGRTYAFDSLGRLRQENRDFNGDKLIRTFRYDSLGQLRSHDRATAPVAGMFCPGQQDSQQFGATCTFQPGSWTWLERSTMTYDAAGNLTKQVDLVPNDTTIGTVAEGNRLTSWDGVGYGYDLDGNRAFKARPGADTIHYKWSADGLLDTVRVGSVALNYVYNALGQLVQRKRGGTSERYLLWDGTHLIAEFNGTATERRAEYAYMPGIDMPIALVTGAQAIAATRFFHLDELGNVIGATSSAGAVVHEMEYDPWGGVLSSAGTAADSSRLRWKGLVWEGDSTRLYYTRTRWFDGESRVFLSEDPIGIEGGINIYLFAGNDPANHSDPFGMKGCPTGFVPAVDEEGNPVLDEDGKPACARLLGGSTTTSRRGSLPPGPSWVSRRGPSGFGPAGHPGAAVLPIAIKVFRALNTPCGRAAVKATMVVALDAAILVPAVGPVLRFGGLYLQAGRASKLLAPGVLASSWAHKGRTAAYLAAAHPTVADVSAQAAVRAFSPDPQDAPSVADLIPGIASLVALGDMANACF
jgi:RHS repeat-associated protein